LKAISFSDEQAEKRRAKAVMRVNKVFFMLKLFAAKIVFISILPSGTSANGGGFCLGFFFYGRNFP
jgi:hypothetical protein